LREITDKREETLRFQDTEIVTIERVLGTLSESYGKDFKEYVYNKKSRKVRSFLQFLVNGRGVPPDAEMNTRLSDGDVLAIVPPVGGG